MYSAITSSGKNTSREVSRATKISSRIGFTSSAA